MTKEELRDYYKIIERNKVNDDIEVIDLYNEERSNNRHVRLLFAFNKLYYTGDMGTYVFGNTIHHIKTFFRGNEINPGYWMEKVEAYSQPLLEQNISKERVLENIHKELEDYDENFIDEEHTDYLVEIKDALEDFIFDYDSAEIRAYDAIKDFFEKIDYYDASDTAYFILRKSQNFSNRFLYACEVIQWVENEILTWGDVNGI